MSTGGGVSNKAKLALARSKSASMGITRSRSSSEQDLEAIDQQIVEREKVNDAVSRAKSATLGTTRDRSSSELDLDAIEDRRMERSQSLNDLPDAPAKENFIPLDRSQSLPEIPKAKVREEKNKYLANYVPEPVRASKRVFGGIVEKDVAVVVEDHTPKTKDGHIKPSHAKIEKSKNFSAQRSDALLGGDGLDIHRVRKIIEKYQKDDPENTSGDISEDDKRLLIEEALRDSGLSISDVNALLGEDGMFASGSLAIEQVMGNAPMPAQEALRAESQKAKSYVPYTKNELNELKIEQGLREELMVVLGLMNEERQEYTPSGSQMFSKLHTVPTEKLMYLAKKYADEDKQADIKVLDSVLVNLRETKGEHLYEEMPDNEYAEISDHEYAEIADHEYEKVGNSNAALEALYESAITADDRVVASHYEVSTKFQNLIKQEKGKIPSHYEVSEESQDKGDAPNPYEESADPYAISVDHNAPEVPDRGERSTGLSGSSLSDHYEFSPDPDAPEVPDRVERSTGLSGSSLSDHYEFSPDPDAPEVPDRVERSTGLSGSSLSDHYEFSPDPDAPEVPDRVELFPEMQQQIENVIKNAKENMSKAEDVKQGSDYTLPTVGGADNSKSAELGM